MQRWFEHFKGRMRKRRSGHSVESEERKHKGLIRAKAIKPAVSASWQLGHSNGETEALSFLLSTFKMKGFQVLQKNT